jgi:hypothetical protein
MSSGSSRGGERGRADEVAEHDRELAAFGGVGRLRARRGDRGGVGRLGDGERRDSLEQAFPMPQGYADLFEIVFRQVPQNFGVNVILPKQRLILAEIEASQPLPDIRDRFPAAQAR